MTFGKGIDWGKQGVPQMNIDKAVHVAHQTTPAIVQAAIVKNNAYYEKALETNDQIHRQERGRILKEWKESGVWRQKYDSWSDACESAANITRRYANLLIAEVGNHFPVDPQISNDLHKQKASLDKPSNKVDKPANVPRGTDPEEKPRVQTATEKLTGPDSETGPSPKQNGKPKYALPIWKELSDSLFGRALNRIDELNRQCPNAVLHAQLIAVGKQCLDILERWKQGV